MDTILNVLEVLRQALDQYLQNISRREDNWVVLSSLVDHRRTACESCRDKVVLTLYNMTTEAAANIPAGSQPGADNLALLPAPVYIRLHMICMANFADKAYKEGLAAISRVITFFQQNPAFNHSNTPNLDSSVEKIVLSLNSLDLTQINHVLGALGATYAPCAFYNIRLLPFTSQAMFARTYPASGTSMDGGVDDGRES